jgi:hypothetical protein
MSNNDHFMLDDLEEELFKSDATTLIIFAGLDNQGERYVDIEIANGHAQIDQRSIKDSTDCIGEETLRDAIAELLKRLQE